MLPVIIFAIANSILLNNSLLIGKLFSEIGILLYLGNGVGMSRLKTFALCLALVARILPQKITVLANFAFVLFFNIFKLVSNLYKG